MKEKLVFPSGSMFLKLLRGETGTEDPSCHGSAHRASAQNPFAGPRDEYDPDKRLQQDCQIV